MKKLRGFKIQSSLEEKCWKLSSYILAQYDFENLSHPANAYWCIFGTKFKDSFETFFLKELVELSGLIRALLDNESIKVEKEIFETNNCVGLLHIKNGKTIGLSYREACNKIIHSTSFKIELIHSKNHPLNNDKNGYNESELTKFKNPRIITKGNYQGKSWTAEIDFLKFIDRTMNLPE